MTDIERLDYFELSRHAACFANEVVELLTGRIAKQAEMFLREGFVVTEIGVLNMAADNFSRFKDWPAVGPALMDTSQGDRGDLIAAIASSFCAMNDAIDITWSSVWIAFVTDPVRSKLTADIAEFGACWRNDRESLLPDLEADWRRHHETERYDQ